MPTRPTMPDKSSRLHASGKLSFRRRVPDVAPEQRQGLPCIELSDDPPHLDELVPDGFHDVEIEVGPGKGTFLLAAAAARPDTFLLGIEASPGYARHAALRLVEAGRRNALLLVDNAKLYLHDRVGPGQLARVHVYYPDPWPKRRHRKRRFFTEDGLDACHHALRAGGWLLVATDNSAYAGEICAALGAEAGFARDEAEEQRLCQAPPGHGFSPTSFEEKYRQEGRILRRYAYVRL